MTEETQIDPDQGDLEILRGNSEETAAQHRGRLHPDLQTFDGLAGDRDETSAGEPVAVPAALATSACALPSGF